MEMHSNRPYGGLSLVSCIPWRVWLGGVFSSPDDREREGIPVLSRKMSPLPRGQQLRQRQRQNDNGRKDSRLSLSSQIINAMLTVRFSWREPVVEA